jgi:hypothetical protein
MPQKDPNVFYHLQTALPVSASVFYLLRKKGSGGVEDWITQASARAGRLKVLPSQLSAPRDTVRARIHPRGGRIESE